MAPHKVLYRLRWQWSGDPEHQITGGYESVKIIEALLKDWGVDKIELRVAEATSARLPAPGAESIERVDQEPRGRQGGRHAAPRAAEPDSEERDDGIDHDAMARLARRAFQSTRHVEDVTGRKTIEPPRSDHA